MNLNLHEVPPWQYAVMFASLRLSGAVWNSVMMAGGPKKAWESDDVLLAILKTKPKHNSLESVSLPAIKEQAQEDARRAAKFVDSGGTILGANGPHELGRLQRALSSPICIFLRGKPELLYCRPMVAIVGTRNPSDRCAKRAFELARNLAKQGTVVISGGATGVDLAAHSGALAGGGQTIAILGDPLCEFRDERPARILALKPSDRVTTVTPFGPWITPSRSLFVIRNQYVAALGDAVVVFEGREKSGTLHTAQFAHKMGVPVWAVPGDPDDELSFAPNSLLENGTARALFRNDVLFNELKLKTHDTLKSPETSKQIQLELKPNDSALVQILKESGGRISLDMLCEKLGVNISKLQQELLELELIGQIHKEGAAIVLNAD